MPDDLLILCDILKNNIDALRNAFLRMWAATIEMMSLPQFPDNHLESMSCETDRFESDQFVIDRLRELRMNAKNNPFCTESFKHSIVFTINGIYTSRIPSDFASFYALLRSYCLIFSCSKVSRMRRSRYAECKMRICFWDCSK
jgi:hypothetical protein